MRRRMHPPPSVEPNLEPRRLEICREDVDATNPTKIYDDTGKSLLAKHSADGTSNQRGEIDGW